MHMYVCKRSRHSWTLCEGRTVSVFKITTQKFLVICESLVSVILRLFRGIFLISTFLLGMLPLDFIKIMYFSSHSIKSRGFTICKYLKFWGLRSSGMLRGVVERVQLKCDGTRWRRAGEVKGKLTNVVGSQYSSHYLGTWSIQHYYAEAHTSSSSSRLNWSPRRFKWTRPFRREAKSGFCACAITFQTQYNWLPRFGIISKFFNDPVD
jgi:hypothetical protein